MYGSMAVVGEFAPFIQFCFLACYVAFVLTKPGIREWLLVTAAGAVLGVGFVRLHLGPWISGMGLATALWAVLALACWNALEKRWTRTVAYLAMAVGWMLLIRFALPVLYLSLAASGGKRRSTSCGEFYGGGVNKSQ